MAFVQVMKNKKVGFAEKLRQCVEQSRREEREIEEYMWSMDFYKKVQENPFDFTFEHIIMAEDTLDAMIVAAVADQRKHRKFAEKALKQM
jgi:hypothetical protein